MATAINVKDSSGSIVSVATNDAVITALNALGTQATLAAILAKIIASPATAAKQDTIIAALSNALPAGVNQSGVTASGNKEALPANAARQGGAFQNISDTNMFVNMTGENASATNGFLVPPGGGINIMTNEAVTVYCASAGKNYVAMEF